MYAALKLTHILLAAISISGFVLRAWWSYRSSPLLQRTAVRVLPHIVDTLFLLSGFVLVYLASLPVIESAWLVAKIIGLVAYVVIGTVAIRRGKTAGGRLLAAAVASTVFIYIVGAAVNKSPWSWLAT